MTALYSYSTGTVSVAADGTTVTGVGTIWSGTNARPGDIFQIGNYQTIITDVTDITHLEIPPWGGGVQSAVAYKVWQVSPQRFAGAQAMQDVSALVAALNTSGFFVFVDVALTTPDPSLGDDGQYAFQPTTGKTWAKVAGVWTFLGIYKGFNFSGAYNGSTTYSLNDVMTDAGSSYVWINATPGSGHAAPNATYWQLLASIGATGSTGPTGPGYGGTSTTSLAIAVASKAFTTQAGLAYTNGARVRASSAANTSNWMEGLATYSGTTLTIAVDKIGGSGTLADWNLNIVGQPGAGDLSSANNLSDVANKATSRNNLGAVGVVKKQVLTSSGAYTPSANLLYAIIECQGAGAGGGGATVAAAAVGQYGGGGGTSGGYSKTYASAAAIGASQTVTIGAAGLGGSAGANNGTDGGATSLGTLCVANGGKAGKFGSVGQFGVGGATAAAGTGDVAATGSGAGCGPYATTSPSTNSFMQSGFGASSPFGGGGAAQLNGAGAGGTTNGAAAGGYGAGGSGGIVQSQTTSNALLSAAGGNGAAGIVVITEFCSS